MNIHGPATPKFFSRFGVAATSAAIAIALLSPASTVETLAFDMTRIVGQQMRLIRYQASEHQRKVAEERARAFVAAQRRAAASPKIAKEPKADQPKVAAKPKKLPRYLAVDTVKDKRASPKAKKVVMLWDTQSETFVGNNIYDVENPPPLGSTAKFETLSAEYIGAGL
jgi:hypothetical protein